MSDYKLDVKKLWEDVATIAFPVHCIHDDRRFQGNDGAPILSVRAWRLLNSLPALLEAYDKAVKERAEIRSLKAEVYRQAEEIRAHTRAFMGLIDERDTLKFQLDKAVKERDEARAEVVDVEADRDHWLHKAEERRHMTDLGCAARDKALAEVEHIKECNQRLGVANCELNIALFHVENGLGYPDTPVGELIDAANLIRVNAALKSQLDKAEKVLKELVETAGLRGDNDLPHPADDPKTWSARMQTAWDEADAYLARTEKEAEHGDRRNKEKGDA